MGWFNFNLPFLKRKEETELDRRTNIVYGVVKEALKEINPNKQDLMFICLNENEDTDSKTAWRTYIRVHEKLLKKYDDYYCWFFFETYEDFVSRRFKINNTIKFAHALNTRPKNVSVMGICLRSTIERTLNICIGKCANGN